LENSSLAAEKVDVLLTGAMPAFAALCKPIV
jgi:hypothetical protein